MSQVAWKINLKWEIHFTDKFPNFNPVFSYSLFLIYKRKPWIQLRSTRSVKHKNKTKTCNPVFAKLLQMPDIGRQYVSTLTGGQSISVGLIMRHISHLCLSLPQIKTSHSIHKFLLYRHSAAYSSPSLFSFAPPSLFPKQCVSDTCNIPAAGVSERNQRQDLSLLTLSVACPLFLWSFYYRTAICSINTAHHTVQR